MRDVLYCNKMRRKAGLALVYHRTGLLQGFQLYCGRLPCPLLLRRQAVPDVESADIPCTGAFGACPDKNLKERVRYDTPEMSV